MDARHPPSGPPAPSPCARRRHRGFIGGGGGARPAAAHIAVTVIGAVALVVLAAAWGRGPSTAPARRPSSPRSAAVLRSSNTAGALAFSACMRRHGVPDFPDPTSTGAIPKVSRQELANPSFQAAERRCQHLLPPGENDSFPAGEVQQMLIGMLRFSRCMRSHGVPNWPDPATDALGRPEFPLSSVPGTSRRYWHSARIGRAANVCGHLLPGPLHGNTPVA